jgi:hypothetical protein
MPGNVGKEAAVRKRRHSGMQGAVWEKKLDAADMPWTNIGHALTAVALTALDVPGQKAQLFCVTSDGKLWWRDLAVNGTTWRVVATGCGATTLAAVNVPGQGQKLFCTTADQLLYARDAVPADVPWHCLGDALGVTALAALGDPGEGAALYCATDHQVLYRRDAAAGPDTPWKAAGEAADVCGLAALVVPETRPQLYCATRHKVLYRRPASADAAWEPLGNTPLVLSMTGAAGRLFILTPGERDVLAPIPHHVFLPVRKQVNISAHVGAQEPRRITITDEFGLRVAGWVSDKAIDIAPTPYFAEHGSTPGVVVLEVLYERQFEGDPDWYGMRCKVHHQRGGPGTYEELTIAADDTWVKFRWPR